MDSLGIPSQALWAGCHNSCILFILLPGESEIVLTMFLVLH